MKQTKPQKIKRRAVTITLRVITTLLWLLTAIFILLNGMTEGSVSSSKSDEVTSAVQAVAGAVAPESWVANATGETLELLHSYVRTAAHFLEYCLFGALSVWCYLVWDSEKVGVIIPLSVIFYFPMIDEYLQSLTPNRAAEGADILVDISGGLTGFAFAFLVAWMVWLIVKKRRKKEEKA